MGFSAGFNANYFCRFCRILKLIIEDTTISSGQLKIMGLIVIDNNFNRMAKRRIQFRSADISHDFLEGLLELVVLQLLEKIIFDRKYFSIATFNKRLKQHDFGPLESMSKKILKNGMCIYHVEKFQALSCKRWFTETLIF